MSAVMHEYTPRRHAPEEGRTATAVFGHIGVCYRLEWQTRRKSIDI